MGIPGSDHVRGMRHARSVASVPSLSLRQRGRAERLRESANIAAGLATLQARRRILTAGRRDEGGRHG